MMAETGLLASMQKLDAFQLPEKVQKKVKERIDKENFNPNDLKAINQAAMSISKWVVAVVKFVDVSKDVKEKESLVKKLDEELRKAKQVLEEKQSELAAANKKVSDLKQLLDDNLKEKERLENEKDLTQKRLDRASILTQGLADEQIRWRESVERLKQDVIKLVGDVFTAAASVSYLGPFTGAFRYAIIILTQ